MELRQHELGERRVGVQHKGRRDAVEVLLVPLLAGHRPHLAQIGLAVDDEAAVGAEPDLGLAKRRRRGRCSRRDTGASAEGMLSSLLPYRPNKAVSRQVDHALDSGDERPILRLALFMQASAAGRGAMSGKIDARLKELGIELPQPTAPSGELRALHGRRQSRRRVRTGQLVGRQGRICRQARP